MHPVVLRFHSNSQESAFWSWYSFLCTKYMDPVAGWFSLLTYLLFVCKVWRQSNRELLSVRLQQHHCVPKQYRTTKKTQYVSPSWSLTLLLINLGMRTFPVACLWWMPRPTYVRYRHHIIFAVRSTRIITHLSDNVWHGFAPNRLCSYHKTVLLTAMLVINPIMLPLLVQLPLQLHLLCEVLNATLLTLAAASPIGLCAQLRAQLHTVQQQKGLLMMGDVGAAAKGLGEGSVPAGNGTGWLGGELAADWPVCVTTQNALTNVCMTALFGGVVPHTQPYTQVATWLSRGLLWNHASLAPVASQHACQAVTLFGIIGLILPTTVVLYLLELRLRCRFHLRTCTSVIVPEVKHLLVQQGLLLLLLAFGLIMSCWETLVLLVSQHMA